MKKGMICASALNQRVILQQSVVSYDEIGGQMVSWEDVASLWAQIEPLRGTEPFINQKFAGRTLVRIRLRYREDVDVSKRLKRGSIVYEILQVLNLEVSNHTVEILSEVKQ